MPEYRPFITLTNQTFVAVARTLTTIRFLGEEHYTDNDGIVRVYGTGLVELPHETYWDLVTIVDGEYFGKPFSGSSAGASWTGTPNASTSTLPRFDHMFRMVDAISSTNEPFKCVVHTRIMSFSAAQRYKRLFWWGLDGVFRLNVLGAVQPIIFNQGITWEDALRYTWDQMLSYNWDAPGGESPMVETLRPDVGATAQRKFTRFRKKLRFRQLQFQLAFNTRGDTATAPTRLFSIHAEVTPAQTVSKAIT